MNLGFHPCGTKENFYFLFRMETPACRILVADGVLPEHGLAISTPALFASRPTFCRRGPLPPTHRRGRPAGRGGRTRAA